MTTLKIPKRLKAAAAMVRRGARVADVGCDHGLLSAYLITQGIARSVVASDCSAPSLKKAAALFARLEIADRAQAVLCEGLLGIAPGSVDDVVIAGLGADTILAILAAAPWLKSPDARLVLVPSARDERLRRSLYAAGFEILSERAVAERGRCYAVLSVGYAGRSERVSLAFAWFGKIAQAPRAGDNAAYIKSRSARLAAIARGLEATPGGARLEKYAEVQSALEYFESLERELKK